MRKRKQRSQRMKRNSSESGHYRASSTASLIRKLRRIHKRKTSEGLEVCFVLKQNPNGNLEVQIKYPEIQNLDLQDGDVMFACITVEGQMFDCLTKTGDDTSHWFGRTRTNEEVKVLEKLLD